jgi:hypothetical protein
MSEKCHGHADTFSQNKHNIYGYTDSKGLKISGGFKGGLWGL